MNTGSVATSYSTGGVAVGTSSTNTGGFVGNTSGTIASSYWDTDASTQANGFGTGSVTGLFGGCYSGTCAVTTGANATNPGASVTMNAQATYTGWDFTNTWAINAGASYPYFKTSSFIPAPLGLTIPVATGLGAGINIDLLIGGSIFGTVYTTNASGIANIILNSTQLGAGATAIAYVPGNSLLGNLIFNGSSSTGTLATQSFVNNTVTSIQVGILGTPSVTSIATARGTTVSDSGLLFTNSSGTLQLTSAYNFTANSGSKFTLNGNITASGGGIITLASITTLSASSILTATNQIAINSTIDGANALTLSAFTVNINAAIGGTTSLNSLSATGATGSVTTLSARMLLQVVHKHIVML